MSLIQKEKEYFLKFKEKLQKSNKRKQLINPLLKEIFHKNENVSILDFGCGDFSTYKYLKKNQKLIGIEKNKFFRKNKKEVYPSLNNVNFKFDIIIVCMVLHYNKNYISLIKTLKKYLKKNNSKIHIISYRDDFFKNIWKNKKFKNVKESKFSFTGNISRYRL